MASSVIIIHFQPLELYPPVMNLVDFINEEHKGKRVVVLTASTNTDTAPFKITSANIRIKRLAKFYNGQSGINRYINYLSFYFRCLVSLIKERPAAVLYFETLSAFSVWVYKKFFARAVPVLIHYHEYTSPLEYQTGMKLSRFFHVKEQWLYKRAAWISHTNEERLQFFLRDEGLNGPLPVRVLPNFPSRKWKSKKERGEGLPFRIVYVGALSLNTMYVEALVNWVIANKGQLSLDIYSNNIEEAAKNYLAGLQEEHIHLHDAISYNQLPLVLEKYDVGVILYNGHIPNYVFNAPNKLFEYLACGLDVWFPVVMKGCMPYVTTGTTPKVVPVDFTDLKSFDPARAMRADGCVYKEPVYYSEYVLPALTNELFKHAR